MSVTDIYNQPDLTLHTTSKELISTPEIIPSDIVSVIPAYNDQEGLEITLRSLDRFGLAMIVAVDDGSEPPLKAPSNISTPFKMIRHDENRGVAAARNTGTFATKSDWIYFTDCGCIHFAGLFTSYKKSRASAGPFVSAVVGPVVATTQGRLGTFYTEEEILNPPIFHNENDALEATSIVGCNALISRAAMDKVGHFDEKTYGTNFGEDTDLGIQLYHVGKILWCEYAGIAHDFTESLDVFDSRFKSYGKAVRLVSDKYNLDWTPQMFFRFPKNFINLGERRNQMYVEGFGV